MRCGDGLPPPHRELVWGRAMPHAQIFWTFELKMASFGVFWELILLQLNCVSYAIYKPVSRDFGL